MDRYCNMNYMFYQSLKNTGLKYYVVSYDIVCQWSIHLEEHMEKIDDHFWMFATDDINVIFLIPKFHLPAHIPRCHTVFSHNYTLGVGCLDGEALEQGWAKINPLAPSTREIGPRSRHNTLDYHFGDSNWQKITGLGRGFTLRNNAPLTNCA